MCPGHSDKWSRRGHLFEWSRNQRRINSKSDKDKKEIKNNKKINSKNTQSHITKKMKSAILSIYWELSVNLFDLSGFFRINTGLIKKTKAIISSLMKIKVFLKMRDIWKYYNKINQLKIRSILMNSKLILFCKFYKYSTK